MLSRTKLAVAFTGLVLSLGTGAGIASAVPDVSAVVGTTCSYQQVIAALNAQSPADGAQFTASPVATSWLQRFLAAPADQRRQMVQQVQGVPGAQSYTGLVLQVMNSCNNY
jgi:hemophore-related protein